MLEANDIKKYSSQMRHGTGIPTFNHKNSMAKMWVKNTLIHIFVQTCFFLAFRCFFEQTSIFKSASLTGFFPPLIQWDLRGPPTD